MTKLRPSAKLGSMHGIGLREASEKYGIPRSTLSRHVAAGLIRKVQEAGGRGHPMLLFEPDVAQMAQSFVPGRRPGRGHRLSLDDRASVA